MSATGSGYDYSVTTFTPDGRVFQVEYADKAVEKSGLTLGVKCVDGVVLGAEKLIISKMMVKGSNRNIAAVDLHAGIATAGLKADGRQLINKARSEAREYRSFYGADIPGQALADRIGGHVHMHTLYWYLRPFGLTSLIACMDSTGPELYMVNPAGITYRYFAAAAGKQKSAAQTELEKLDFKTITCRDAVKAIANIIFKLHDDVKDKAFELELSWVCAASNKKFVRVPDAVYDDAVALAKAAKERADMESDSDSDEDEEGEGEAEE
eukprot:gb/GEZN01014234.1/.p1 GENE.gb/GEZN01014234.1/~~gb/GEZN01014234.1/.p1  ORF type:complete len:267 (-),score=50.88 gb/GEZN01014234.1/:140-940(-)